MTNIKFKPKRMHGEGTILFKDTKGRTVIRRAHNFLLLGLFETEIWDMCDGKTTINEIASFVSNKYGITLKKAYDEISRFQRNLKEKELISLENDINENNFN